MVSKPSFFDIISQNLSQAKYQLLVIRDIGSPPRGRAFFEY